MLEWLIVCLVACVMPLQAIVNGRLGQVLANPFLAAFTSFASGTLILGAVVLAHARGIPRLPEGVKVPWILLTGGLLGCIYVTAVLHYVPRLGAANVLTAGIVGQLLMGLLLDQFGLLGMPVHHISLPRLAGVGLLVLGTWLVQNG